METDSQTLKLAGGQPLKGEVLVRGAKNSIPKNLVAALLATETSRLQNVAAIEDVAVVGAMVQALGGQVQSVADGTLEVTAKDLHLAPPEKLLALAGKSRIPILFAGPLLARLGEAYIPELGGCRIGPRPVDFHLKVLEALGAKIESDANGWRLRTDGLRGAKIRLDYPSVGATEQTLLASVLAEGLTELKNAAIEPEIIDLIALLQKMGAIISVETDRVIKIVGVKQLRGYIHTTMTDRLEVASWAAAAAATNGEIFVRRARQLDIMTFLNKFRQVGGGFEVQEEGIRFFRKRPLTSIALETAVHPGFMTDWQQPFTVLLTQAAGASVIHETVYEDRFGYVTALNKMGAKIQLYSECLGGDTACRFGRRNLRHSAVVIGPTPLIAAEIEVPDLRGGFSYIIAALVANGISTIKNVQIINRGYENFTTKLRSLGAKIVG